MALISRFSNPLLFLIATLILPLISPALVNDKQSVTLNYEVAGKGSIFINLENVIQLSSPFHLTTGDSKSCHPQLPSLSQTEEIPFVGTFPNGERAFIFVDHYYIIRIDKQTRQINLGTYALNSTKSNTKRVFIQNQRYMFKKESNDDLEIIGFQLFKSTGFFRTKSEVIFFNFANLDTPSLITVFPVKDAPIHCFGVVVGRTLYVATENTLVAYDLQSAEKHSKIKELSSFDAYSLTNNTQQKIKNIQSICICEDIVFIAEGNSLLAFKDRSGIFNATSIPITKVISFDDIIIHAQKVGRSLVIMTEKNIIEYIFRNDCLDLEENFRFSIEELGIDHSLPIQDKILFTELKGSSKGKYFAMVNRLKTSVYIFETAKSQQDSNMQPYIHFYKSQETLETVDLFDYFTNYTLNGIGMIVKHRRDQLSVVVLLRNPAGVTCSHLFPFAETQSIRAESKFCHNGVYNYTAFLAMGSNGKSNETYTSDIYFDPSLPCERTILLHLSYGWSTTVIVAAICVLSSILIVVLLITKRYYNKKKVKKYRGHKRFHNEKESLDNSASVHKIDISSLSLPPSSNRRGNENNENSRRKPRPGAQQKQKSFTKKKNLTIKIPEQ